MLSGTPKHLLEALSTFDKVTKRLLLKLTWSMTELVHMGDHGNTPPFQLDNVMIHFVFGLQYRGCTALRIIMGVTRFHHVNNMAESRPNNPCISSCSNVESVLVGSRHLLLH